LERSCFLDARRAREVLARCATLRPHRDDLVPTGTADCDALDDPPRRQCTYDPDAPVPDPVHGPFIDFCDPF
jgi:hypothetical protein